MSDESSGRILKEDGPVVSRVLENLAKVASILSEQNVVLAAIQREASHTENNLAANQKAFSEELRNLGLMFASLDKNVGVMSVKLDQVVSQQAVNAQVGQKLEVLAERVHGLESGGRRASDLNKWWVGIILALVGAAIAIIAKSSNPSK